MSKTCYYVQKYIYFKQTTYLVPRVRNLEIHRLNLKGMSLAITFAWYVFLTSHNIIRGPSGQVTSGHETQYILNTLCYERK